jgi:membrane dipeptidase
MSWCEHLRILSFMRGWIAQRPAEYRLVANVDDVRRCLEEGKLGIVFDVEGTAPVEEDISLVQTFYELGVRWMLIAYNRNNKAGGGCMDNDGGLSDFGRCLLDEMARVGMVPCLSHCGVRTAAEAIEYVRGPSIFSHSNPAGCHPNVRNISDELILACVAKGGVVGLSGLGAYLGTETGLVDQLLRQIRYVIDLVGPLHVGLGLDYIFDRDALNANIRANPEKYPPGISEYPAMIAPESVGEIIDGLLADNLTEEEVQAVLGQNWHRIAKEVWK